MLKILAFAGSLRGGSFNRHLLQIAMTIAKQQADVTHIDLRDFELPYYNGDIEDNKGLPEKALELVDLIRNHDAILLATPEYNYSMPGHLKNTFDWVSRAKPQPWANKSVLLLSASPSLTGGTRGVWQLRVPFECCSAFVYPEIFSLASANEAFLDDSLRNPNLQDRLESLVKRFIQFATIQANSMNQSA